MIRSFLNRLLDFAGDCWASEYATGSPLHRLPLLGSDDAEAQIALGGGATEHPGCDGPAADFARNDLKFPVHGRTDTQWRQQ